MRKLEAGEGFSALLVSDHTSGKKMTKYVEDSVEAALRRCEEELNGELGDALRYALVFDARTQIEGELKPMLVFQMEERGQEASVQFAQLYQLKKKFFSAALKFHPLEDFRAIGRGKPWLAANV